MEQVVAGGLRLARRVVPAYAANPRVVAVMVGGSVARGLANRYSDLELGVFRADPPADGERPAAFNRVYYPSPQDKWIDWLVAKCPVAPADLAPRLKGVFRATPAEGCRHLRALIYETLDLVDRHLPRANEPAPGDPRRNVSTDWARRRFADPPWDDYTLMRDMGTQAPVSAATVVVP